jgi:hypothetical protein
MQHPPHSERRFSLAAGISFGTIGTILGFALTPASTITNNSLLRLLFLLASFALLVYFPHCLAHYFVGELTGLKFSHYVLGSSPLANVSSPVILKLDTLFPRLGIRLKPESRERSTPRQRLLMFSSGIVASTLLPLFPTEAAYLTLPMLEGLVLPVLWLGYLAFGVYFSPRYGDLSRIKTHA